MSAAHPKQPQREYDSLRDLIEARIQPPEIAVDHSSSEWYLVLWRAAEPAGELEVTGGGTLIDHIDCNAREEVLLVVTHSELTAADLALTDVSDVYEAAQAGAIDFEAIPASWLVPAVDRFKEVRDRGEWSGVVDYFEEEEP